MLDFIVADYMGLSFGGRRRIDAGRSLNTLNRRPIVETTHSFPRRHAHAATQRERLIQRVEATLRSEGLI